MSEHGSSGVASASASASAVEKVVIIGSGPSAWTAALYAGRANLAPLVIGAGPGRFTSDAIPGGQLMSTTEVENFPSQRKITGPELVRHIRDQALQFGVRIQTDNGPETAVQTVGDAEALYHWQACTELDLGVRPFVITTDGGQKIRTHTIIIATGARAKYIGIESEQKYLNFGVSACAVCDGAIPRFRNKPLMVVGGGDSAMEEALFLTHFGSVVYVVHRRDQFRASKVMQQRVLEHKRIKVLWNRTVDEVLGSETDGVTGVRLRSTAPGEEAVTEEVAVTGMFVAIGHEPNTKFLNGQLELKPNGYIQVKPYRTDTSVPGVFASGDVVDDWYRQAITAAGTGCAAALDAERYLASQGLE